VLAVAVGTVAGDCDPGVGVAAVPAERAGAAQGLERSAVEPQAEAWSGPAGGSHAVDGAAEGRPAEAESVGSAVDFKMVEDCRIEFLEVAIVVGEVDGDPSCRSVSRACGSRG